jgi:hypothetical protein
MPCTVAARGTRSTTSIPPFSGTFTPALPFNDTHDNTPCGRKILTSVNGVNVAAESLCPLHWTMVHGQRDYVLPVVLEP